MEKHISDNLEKRIRRMVLGSRVLITALKDMNKNKLQFYEEKVTKVKANKELEDIKDLPLINVLTIHYTIEVEKAERGRNSNPTKQKSQEQKKRNQLRNLIQDYNNSIDDDSIMARLRFYQKSENSIEKITFYRKKTMDKIIITEPDIIMDIFYALLNLNLV